MYRLINMKLVHIIINPIINNYQLASLTLLLVAFFWGVTFTIIKSALNSIDPFYFIGFRFLVASILFALMIRNWKAIFNKRLFKDSLILGILSLICYVSQTIGLEYTKATNSAFITSFYVLFVPFMSYFLYKERIRILAVSASVLAFGGLTLLMSGDLSQMNIGDIITFLSALTYAGHIAYTGKVTHRHSTLGLSFYQIIFVSLVSFTCVPLGSGKLLINREVIFVILFTAIFCTTFAYFMQTKLQRIIKPTTTAVIFATEPLFATLAAAFINNEILLIHQYIGCLLIVIATIIAQLKIKNL